MVSEASRTAIRPKRIGNDLRVLGTNTSSAATAMEPAQTRTTWRLASEKRSPNSTTEETTWAYENEAAMATNTLVQRKRLNGCPRRSRTAFSRSVAAVR